MSWSISIIGVPEKVTAKLDEYGATLSGPSKDEFEAAKPHLQALAAENVGANVLIKLNAGGHGNFTDGKKTYGNCTVNLEIFYAQLAL